MKHSLHIHCHTQLYLLLALLKSHLKNGREREQFIIENEMLYILKETDDLPLICICSSL